ncbi:MAG: 4-alpha-glucanotransferase [Verrucomicrobiales bacterium]
MPEKSPPPPLTAERSAGLILPVPSLRRTTDLGAGDLRTLREMIDWASGAGFAALELLPIFETAERFDPFLPITAFAIDPLYIEATPAALFDLEDGAYAETLGKANLEKLRGSEADFAAVRRLKLDLVWEAFEIFHAEHYQKGTDRDRRFQKFCEVERGWLESYCLFHISMDMEGHERWHEWGETRKDAAAARQSLANLIDKEAAATEKQLAFYGYVQWIAQAQWTLARQYAESLGVALIGQLPALVPAASADAFGQPEIFREGWWGGMAPEECGGGSRFADMWGRNDGLAVPDWDAMEIGGYQWCRARMRRARQLFHAARLTNAAKIYRTYAFPWPPEKDDYFGSMNASSAAEKCRGRLPGFLLRPDNSQVNRIYNRNTGEAMLAAMVEEAGEGFLLAENDALESPEYLSPSMVEYGVLPAVYPGSELRADGTPRPGREFSAASSAAYGAGGGTSLPHRWEHARITLETEGGSGRAGAAARWLFDTLGRFSPLPAGEDPPPFNDRIRETLVRSLFRANSRYAAISLSDLLGLESPPAPAPPQGKSGWEIRTGPSTRELIRNPHWNYIRERTAQLIAESNRRLPEAPKKSPLIAAAASTAAATSGN